MSKQDVIEVEGKVVENLPNAQLELSLKMGTRLQHIFQAN